MDRLLPVFKTKLKADEMKELLNIFSIIINNASELSNVNHIDYYNLKSINRTLIQRLNSINTYVKGWQRKQHVFKMDLNQYTSFTNVYTFNKQLFSTSNPYYDNLFRQLIIEFDKQKISLQ